MDIGYKLTLDNPKKKANALSRLVFGWVFRLLYKGTRSGLKVSDLYKALDDDKSEKLGDQLEKHWNNEVEKAKLKGSTPSLMKALLRTFFFDYMMWGLLFFVNMVVLRSVQPIVLSFLISLFIVPDAQDRNSEMYIYSTVLIGLTIGTVFTYHHSSLGFSVIGMRMRIAVSSLVYRKLTRLNQTSLGITAAGQIVNLLSNDVNRFDFVVLSLHTLWVMPFQVVLISYFLWQQIGVSCLAGLLILLFFSLPVQGYLGKVTGKLRFKIAHKTDARVKLMSEIISGIQVIKMYAWELPFEKLIKILRVAEIKDLTLTSYIRGFFSTCHIFIERSTLFLTTLSFVLLGNIVTADMVFSIAQYYNILQLSLSIFYPMAISLGAEALISVKRLQSFLVLGERESTKFEELKGPGIQLSKVSASWTGNDNTLKDISIQIPPGTLCAVVGPVGAGKSSLLQILLGELPVNSGKVSMGGEISYSSQEPWLFQSTVRSNILFGQPFNRSWYDTVVRVCALQKDFDQFPLGDKTVVGERGVSLSGGQRARINLARAIYRQADIYLLDDPLSAVDTHVGRHLFDECIHRHLKGKTRVLVTHQLQYLKKANLIIVINEGQIEAQGTFEELSKSELDFTKLLVDSDESTTKSNKIDKPEEIDQESLASEALSRKLSVMSGSNSIYSSNMDLTPEIPENGEESSSDPNVSPLWQYIKAARSWFLFFTLIVLLILAQAAASGTDYWVAFWTEQEAVRNANNSVILESRQASFIEEVEVHNVPNHELPSFAYKHAKAVNDSTETKLFSFDVLFDEVQLDNTVYRLLKTTYALYFYGALIVATILLTFARSLLLYKLCMFSSKNLHAKMFHVLLKAPMRFFDTNPSGRVLNRFSKDMGAIDEVLPRVLMDSIQINILIAGILVNVGLSNPYIVIAMLFAGVLFWIIRGWYIASSKVIKHIEGATKSPVFSHVTSTLNGIPTIRASKAEEVLVNQFDEHQDAHTSAWFLTITCMTFFGLWLDIICLIFIASVTYSFVIMHANAIVSGSFVGLAISQSLTLSGMLQHGMRQTAEVINQFTSVERVLQYTKVETEKPLETPREKRPPKSWPSKGKLEFRDLSLRYIEGDPPVLKNLNFTVQPAEKVGIVGRTGAGKSSLISALFQLAPTEGSIFIDGVDIKTLGLKDLRRSISIIPQEPVLFAASMRYNLDPFNEFDDAKLWNALEEVELKDSVDTLDFLVTESGGNFSLGQRQLVCLARAILRNNKILIMDEATANVDPKTDALIQTAIRKKFKDCTVLTIAHRLNTIMDSDKVLAMSFGSMVEFDHPHKLMEIPDGHFNKMVIETGPVMYEQLRKVAQEAYDQKRAL